MVKKLLISLFLFVAYVAIQEALAVPAVPWPVEKEQPDGTKITVLLKGDEKVHWMESQDGYTLMYDAQKYVVYAELDARGNMTPSKIKFGTKSAKIADFKKGLKYSKSQIQAFEQIWEATSDAESNQLRSSGPQKAGATTGERKALVVLMGFKDRPFVKDKSEFETLFNQLDYYPANGSAKGSVRDFFKENSYGKLDFTVTLAGPYTADNDMIYYADQPGDAGYRWFAEEAARKADADVNFNDYADNGTLETFHIIFAGYGDENIDNGKQIWSHKWQMPAITLDGVRISVYSCSPELRGSSGSNTTYIGVVCHELSHVFGAPDYYDTSANGSFVGSGNWDLMASGSWNDNGRTPGHINMFQKILYEWVTPTPLTSFTEITDMPNSAKNPVAYTIKANDNGELYVLENRQKVGFDAGVPGHGLLIWHVHPNALNGRGSNASHPQQLYPVYAAATTAIPTAATYGSINTGGTPFPGTSGKIAFTGKTTPAMFTWTGPEVISKPITEITETGDKISFKFLDGPTTPITNLQAQVVNNNNVKLTWTEANHADVVGYKIYRDDVLQYTITGKNTTTYTQIGVQNGTYNYCVTAYYEATESEKICAEVTITGGSDTYCLPVTDLKAKSTLDKVYLDWTVPFQSGWKTIAGAATSVYNFEQPLTLFMGTTWGPEELKGLDGFELTQFQFYYYERNVPHTVQVWEVGPDNIPVKKYSQLYSGTTTQGSKTVTLTTPVVLDASKTYIVGVEIQSQGASCLVVDAGPQIPNRNYLYVEGGWFSFIDARIDGNFISSIYLSAGTASPAPGATVVLDSRNASNGNTGMTFAEKVQANKPAHLPNINKIKIDDALLAEGPVRAAAAVTKYIIYRDGEPIDESTTNSYVDASGLAPATAYSYCVSAIYSSGCTSEGVCVEATTLAPLNVYNPVENLQASIDDLDVTLTWEKPFANGIVSYGNLTASSAVTNATVTGTTEFIEAIRFTPEELKQANGLNLTKVSFHSSNSTVARKYTIQIYEGGNGTTPGTLVFEQAVASYTNNAWNNIALSTAYVVNAYEDLWIAIKVTRTAANGNLPRPYLSGTVIDGKTNWVYSGSAWSKVASRAWPIFVTVEGGSEPDGYEISRDGSLLATVNADQLSYPDVTTEAKTYEYCVTAKYGTNASDAVCISATTISPYKPIINLQAQVVADEVTLTWDLPKKTKTIFEEGFENGIPATWANIDADGDGQLWYKPASGVAAHTGTGTATSKSYNETTERPLTPNNWLITPAITLTDDCKLVYYVNAQDASYPKEHYGVFISTTDRNITSFVKLFEETMAASPAQPVSGAVAEGIFRSSGQENAQGTWYERTIDLKDYAGQTVYIAFRHFDCTDWFFLNIDDIKVISSSTLPAVYDIYADGTLVADNIPEKEYKLTDVEVGTHEYCVVAVYENGTIVTDAKCKTVSVVELGDPHRPVSNLQGTVNEYEGTLTWDVPEYVHKLSYHTFTGGEFSHIGTGSTADFDIAARFTPEDLKTAGGLMLTKVKFIPVYDKATTSYSIRVWQGGSWGNSRNAGSMIVDQEVTSQTINQFNEVTLDNPVSIDPTKELWIGVRCNTATGHPAAMQTPGAIEGKGNLMYFQGAWATATELGATLNGNWIIDGIAAYHQGLNAAPVALSSLKDAGNRISTGTLSAVEGFVQPVEKAPPVLPSVVKYEISREGAKIGETTGLTYQDVVSASGTYTYAVTTVYDDGISSSPAEVDITYISDCDNAPENVLAVLAGNKAKVTWDYTPVVIPGESNIDVLFNEDFNSGLPAAWTVLDADGDTETWYYDTDGAGDGFVSSDSWSLTSGEILTPDNWLITPKIDLKEGSELKYSVYSHEYFPEEHYGVYVSTTDTDPSSFTLLFEETLTASGAPVAVPVQKVAGMDKPQFNYEGSQARMIDLSAYAGKSVYLAFRHFDCTDMLWMTIDDVTVEAPKAPKQGNFNIYRNNEKIAGNVGVNEYEDLLTESGTYIYGVSFVGQNGCESAITYSGPVEFRATPIDVIVTGLSVADKVYDGTVNAAIQGTAVLGGVLPGDDVTLIAGKAEFNNKNAGTNKPVAFSGFTLGGADKDKYLLSQPESVTADITPLSATVSGLTANNKVYDGTADVVVRGPAVLRGILRNDQVTLISVAARFSDKNVEPDKRVIISGFTLGGADGNNYVLSQTESVTASITPKALIVNGFSAADKVYDGTTTAEVTGAATSFDGLLAGDFISLVIGRADFDNKNVSTNKTVTFSGFSLGGADKDNYNLLQPASVTANIEKAVPEYEDLIKGLVLAGIQGKTLGDIILPAGFTWYAPQTLLSELGEQMFTVTYTPEDTGNYYIIYGIPVIVVVSPGTGILAVEEGIKVYPTLLRSGEILQIESDRSENEEAVIHIFSVTGSLVKQEKVTGKYTRVQMNVAKGVYILRLQDKEVKVIVK